MIRPAVSLILAAMMLGAVVRSPAAGEPDGRPQRVRQLEAQALNRLRHSSAHQLLQDYLLEL